MEKGQHKAFLLVAIFLGGMVAGTALLFLFQQRPQPEPDTSTLKQSLQATAQETIKMPALSEANLQITIQKSQLDREVERIKDLAAKYGGTAVQGSVDSDGADVLAQIPPQLKDRFLKALTEPAKVAGAPLPSELSLPVLIEVRIKFEP